MQYSGRDSEDSDNYNTIWEGLNKDTGSKKILVYLDSQFIEFGFRAASVFKWGFLPQLIYNLDSERTGDIS